MSIGKSLAIAASSLALAGGIAVVGPAQTAFAWNTIPKGCTEWADSNGPGRAGRIHASCPGKNVMVHIYCTMNYDALSNPHWRWQYNHADCSRGGYIRGFNIYVG